MALYAFCAFALVVALFVLSVLAVGALLVSLPATYFLDSHERGLWVDHHPVVRFLLHLVKNLVGLCVLVTGIVLLVPGVPGQAVVTILLGVMLLDFPGKTQLERRLVSYPWILQPVNRLRQKVHRPALVIHESIPEASPLSVGLQETAVAAPSDPCRT